MALRDFLALGVQIAGIAIGTAVGGPLGPAIGGAIGGLIGAIAFKPEANRVEGPRAQDLQVTTSTAGTRIPYIAGRYPVDGNIIWAPDIIEVSTTRRVGKSLFSSGTKITEYSYYFTGAISLCEGGEEDSGEIHAVLRIWAYNKLIYDARSEEDIRATLEDTYPEVADGTVSADEMLNKIGQMTADIDAIMTVYTGTDEQEPDPVMEQYLGAGNVPAYRGQAYVVFNRLPLDQFGYGARVPQLRFEVCRPLPAPTSGTDDDNDGDDVLEAA